MLQYCIKQISTNIKKYILHVLSIELRYKLYFSFSIPTPRFPFFLLYLRCKSGVTFKRRSFRDDSSYTLILKTVGDSVFFVWLFKFQFFSKIWRLNKQNFEDKVSVFFSFTLCILLWNQTWTPWPEVEKPHPPLVIQNLKSVCCKWFWSWTSILKACNDNNGAWYVLFKFKM